MGLDTGDCSGSLKFVKDVPVGVTIVTVASLTRKSSLLSSKAKVRLYDPHQFSCDRYSIVERCMSE